MSESFLLGGGDVVQAVLVQLPAVDLPVLVGVHLVEELLEVALHHLPVEELVAPQLFAHPRLQLPPLQHVVAVVVMLQENVLNEVLAKFVHTYKISFLINSNTEQVIYHHKALSATHPHEGLFAHLPKAFI